MNSLSYKKGPCAQAPQKVGPSIPVSEGQGFYGPFDKRLDLVQEDMTVLKEDAGVLKEEMKGE